MDLIIMKCILIFYVSFYQDAIDHMFNYLLMFSGLMKNYYFIRFADLILIYLILAIHSCFYVIRQLAIDFLLMAF